MFKYLTLIAALTILVSCSNRDADKQNGLNHGDSSSGINGSLATNRPSMEDTAFRLEYFRNMPDTTSGCSQFYTYDSAKNIDSNFIFVGDLQELGMIKVNGQIIMLKKDTLESKGFDGKAFHDVFKGRGYKIILNIGSVPNGDESSLDTGSMEIRFKDRLRIIKVKGGGEC